MNQLPPKKDARWQAGADANRTGASYIPSGQNATPYARGRANPRRLAIARLVVEAMHLHAAPTWDGEGWDESVLSVPLGAIRIADLRPDQIEAAIDDLYAGGWIDIGGAGYDRIIIHPARGGAR